MSFANSTTLAPVRWRKAKQGKYCKDCHGRIEIGAYYAELDPWTIVCPTCFRHREPVKLFSGEAGA